MFTDPIVNSIQARIPCDTEEIPDPFFFKLRNRNDFPAFPENLWNNIAAVNISELLVI